MYYKDCSINKKPCLHHGNGCDTIVCHDFACCISHTPRILSDIIYSTEQYLNDIVKNNYNYNVYGYHKSAQNDDKFGEIKTYKNALERHRLSLLNNTDACLKCSDIQIIIEKIKKITGSQCKPYSRKDIYIDESQKSEWDSTNPYCVSREKWEELAYHVCDTIGIDIKVTNKSALCAVYFELDTNPIMCDVIYELSVHKRNCDLGYKLIRTKEECALDYAILIKKQNCDLTLDQYVKLIDCNISHKLIKKVYDCEMRLEINNKEYECPIIVSLTGQKIPICDIDFNTIVNVSNCQSIFNQ